MMGQNPAAAVTLGFLRDNSGPKWTGAALTGTRLQNVTSFFLGGGVSRTERAFYLFFFFAWKNRFKQISFVQNGLDVAV